MDNPWKEKIQAAKDLARTKGLIISPVSYGNLGYVIKLPDGGTKRITGAVKLIAFIEGFK